MRTEKEVRDEIKRLHKLPTSDESAIIVRMVTMVALEWAVGLNPVAPSERILAVDGGVIEEVEGNGERSGSA